MELFFDTRGNEKQKLAAAKWCDSVTEQILYGGAKYGGKSYLGCNLIFGDAMIYPETYYFIARETLSDIRKYTVPSIYEVYGHWGLVADEYMRYDGKDNFFLLYNGSRVYLIDASYQPRDPDFHRLGSIQMTRGWCEEIGQMHPKAINNLWLTVGRWNNQKFGLKKKMLMTCNPHKGYGFTNFYRPHKEGKLPESKVFITALPQDNKSGDPDYIQSLLNNPDKNERERLAFGNWEYDDDPNAMCGYDDIVAMFGNIHVPESGGKFLTADVARFGSDKARIIVWYGWVAVEKLSFDISATTQIQDAINALRSKHGIPAHHCLADDDGVGGGVVDNCGIIGFVNNARPIDDPATKQNETMNRLTEKSIINAPENYANLQTQCAYKTAELINKHGIYLRCIESDYERQEVSDEFSWLKTYKSDDERKLRILPKDDVKTGLGRSPDWRDVILMRYYFELKKPQQMQGSFANLMRR